MHGVQVLLKKNGYYCDEEDTKWWMFGGSTMAALQTFQACSGLPESGVCDERTWHGLMGDGACPEVPLPALLSCWFLISSCFFLFLFRNSTVCCSTTEDHVPWQMRTLYDWHVLGLGRIIVGDVGPVLSLLWYIQCCLVLMCSDTAVILSSTVHVASDTDTV